ncbi:anti-sigma regulatory factor [Caldicellulosiruptoraceae bacterium PP1]
MNIIKLSIPPKAEYIMIARLTTSGVAARLNFDFEDIEDIKMAISEVLNMFDLSKLFDEIHITYKLQNSFLDIELFIPAYEMIDNDFAEIILKSIIDDVIFTKEPNGYCVKLKKHHQGV